MSHFKSELLPEPDYRTSIAKGEIPRESEIFLIGWNDNVGAKGFPETIQPGGGQYVFLEAAAPLELVSTSQEDRVGGKGATLLAVQGLDADWNKIEEPIFPLGSTPVPLTLSYIRVNRLFLLGAGEHKTNIGQITLRTQSSPKVMQAIIPPDHGASRNGVLSVPAGHQVRIYKNSMSYSTDLPETKGREALIRQHHALCTARYFSTTVVPPLPTTYHFRENIWVSVAIGQQELPTIIPTVLVERSSIELRCHKTTIANGALAGYSHGVLEDLRD